MSKEDEAAYSYADCIYNGDFPIEYTRDQIVNHTYDAFKAGAEWQQNQHKQGAVKWKYCPECGCQEIVNENLVGEGFRECKNCGQDWWIDIDYTDTVRKVLQKLTEKPEPPASIQKQSK